ncbi:predicted protein [Histoplasma capsulatum G186AR]|uniref:Uncharacterized protein n=1 Tax=Ajellomyces capsulatus (strain G186AR / H82 / ATCC MYA-2454 / RMSCC 2432) TaxID=447093 RepID=C0NMM1_AJECG|nr:uncharacterized protein HCBG_03998 [Histoplasma capsulatum G186AR]EEH07119.1 predicted protein [Histoplasma capsulatum G186AR]
MVTTSHDAGQGRTAGGHPLKAPDLAAKDLRRHGPRRMVPMEYHILPQRGLIDHYQELAEPFTKTCMQTAGLHLLTSGEPARKFIVALERIISKRMRLLCLVLSGGVSRCPS